MNDPHLIFDAINRKDVTQALVLLQEQPELVHAVNRRDARRPHALHVAARAGNAEIARALIQAGAVVDVLDTDATSALGVAAFLGHVEVVRELLAAGAKPSVRNNLGFTPLHAARAGTQGSWKNYSPATTADWQEIVKALSAHGAVL